MKTPWRAVSQGPGIITRFAVVVAVSLATGSALAQNMSPEAARRFVAGKLFAFRCVEVRGASMRMVRSSGGSNPTVQSVPYGCRRKHSRSEATWSVLRLAHTFGTTVNLDPGVIIPIPQLRLNSPVLCGMNEMCLILSSDTRTGCGVCAQRDVWQRHLSGYTSGLGSFWPTGLVFDLDHHCRALRSVASIGSGADRNRTEFWQELTCRLVALYPVVYSLANRNIRIDFPIAEWHE